MSSGRAKALRKQSRWAEKRLWKLLRDRRLAGYKFRRQHKERRFFLDCYCLEAKLGVELDGSGHGHPEQQKYDAERDAFLASRGILVKGFWNHQLARWKDRQNILENLWGILQERAPHPENVAPAPHRRSPDKIDSERPSP